MSEPTVTISRQLFMDLVNVVKAARIADCPCLWHDGSGCVNAPLDDAVAKLDHDWSNGSETWEDQYERQTDRTDA